MSYENLEKRIFPGTGKYGIPDISPTDFTGCEFIGFNYAKTEKNRQEKGVHFFLDDYQFERVWNRPETYLKLLQQFKYVMSPDFSTYTDFPMAIQLYNHYKKHWIASFWQENGINVIPTISWSNEESFEWCFDGEPTNSVVAVSSVGTQANKDSKKIFINGYTEMTKRLRPKTILFYGWVPEKCTGNIIKINPFQNRFDERRRKNGRKRE